MGVEFEMKFRLPPGGWRPFRSLQELGRFRLDPLPALDVHDTYYDTAARELLHAGYGLRLRTSKGRTIVTLKTLATVTPQGVHRRNEIETLLPTPTLRVQAWPPSRARDTLLQLIDTLPLEELFVIEQHRERKAVMQNGRFLAELFHDQVVLRAGHLTETWYELELERRLDADEEHLQEIATILQQTFGLEIERRSKFHRGLRLREQLDQMRLSS